MPDSIFGSLPPEQQQQIALKCNSQACKDATNSVIKARNDVTVACAAVTQFNSNRNFFSALAAALWAVVGAVAIAAAVAPWPANLVLWIIAGAFAIGAAIATGFAADADSKLGAAKVVFAAAEQAFKDAVAAVMRDCDNNCYPDLTLPACP